ncbi:MAG: ABC transporter permease, partial [Bacteroidota bacterium]
MNKSQEPPKLVIRFLRWFCHPELLLPIEGDLMELYDERRASGSKRNADLHFIADVLLLFRPSIIKPSDGTYRLNTFGMFKNYFKIGIRNLLKYRAFSFINIFGLAVAMSVCMLIMIMLADQGSYDRYNQNKDRIYRLLSVTRGGELQYATTAFALADEVRQDFPGIEAVAQLRNGLGGDASFNQKTVEITGFFTDHEFFKVFDRQLLHGNEQTALSKPGSIVLSSEKAYALFNTANPIGQTIEFADRGLNTMKIGTGTRQVEWGTFEVTGVIDNQSVKSHLQFDALVSSNSIKALSQEKKIGDLTGNWGHYYGTYTYLMLDKNQSQEDLNFVLK